MSYARTAVTRMTLDMSRLDLQRSETVTLGDTNRRWEVTLINGGAPFRLPPNWTAALTGIKPDGTGLLNGCSVADGKIIYDFAAGAEIATCAGNYPVQFDIWDEVGDLVASPKIYVNVLADVRPREGIKSESEYGLLGEFIAQKNELIADVTSNTNQIVDLIGRINQTDADVDLLGETALAQGDDIAALKEKVTTAGSVTIPASEWTDTTPHEAFFNLNSDVFAKGCIVLFAPEDDATKEAAGKARMSMSVDKVVDAESPFTDLVVIARAESGIVPTIPLNLRYTVIKTDTENKVLVALIGVDAYGEGGGTASGVDEAAVKSIIKQVMPEWTQAETPPSETDPTVSDWAKAKTKPTYTAPEVGLGNVANVRQYSADNPPPYPVTSVNGQVGQVNLPIPSEAADVRADPVGTAETKLKVHNTDNAAHEYIQQRIDALRTLIENFLDIDDESFDQLSEILRDIRANTSALELLGTNKVDKTAISTSMTDSNSEHVASMTLIVALDNALTVAEQAIEDLKTNKQTAAQVAAAINNALSGYLTAVKAAELYQPKGDYLTPEAGDARYAKPSDIPTVPQTLPNPYALNVLGKTYNGSSAVALTVEELIEAIKTASGGVVAWVGEDNSIYLAGNLSEGTYTAYYEVDGAYIEIGDLILGDEAPETKTYTIIWANYDGTVLETDTVPEGQTPTYDGATPTRAADDQYTYTFKGWDKTVVVATADATYTAQYTQTARPVEPVTVSYTLLDSTSLKGADYSEDRTGTAGYCATPLIDITEIPRPCTINLTGARWFYDNDSDSGYVRMHIADISGNKISGGYSIPGGIPTGMSVVNDTEDKTATVTITGSNIGYLRFAGHYTYGNYGTIEDCSCTLTYTPVS